MALKDWTNGVDTCNDTDLDRLELGARGQTEVSTVAATGATETLDPAYGVHRVTMDQACTFTFGTPTLASACIVVILSGAFTPTWPASVDWPDGSAPSYTTPAMFVFQTWDTGTTWYGARVGKAYA